MTGETGAPIPTFGPDEVWVKPWVCVEWGLSNSTTTGAVLRMARPRRLPRALSRYWAKRRRQHGG